jgi:LPS export ABC transporter protein LptC
MDNKTRVAALPTADSYMQNTTTHKFDESGNLAYVLIADSALYFSHDDRLELSTPQLTAKQGAANSAPWRLTADSATTSRVGDNVLLSGAVHAWQVLKTGRNEFFTDDIRFAPSDNVATTEAGVKMINPEGTTTGNGMKADFNRETYQVLANVRSRYHAAR